MTRITSFSVAALLGATVLPAQARNPPQMQGYYRVACIQVNPGKWMQASADSGEIASWYSLRSIAPVAEQARCDYYNVRFYTGTPTPPAAPQALQAPLEKAGVAMTVDEFSRNGPLHLPKLRESAEHERLHGNGAGGLEAHGGNMEQGRQAGGVVGHVGLSYRAGPSCLSGNVGARIPDPGSVVRESCVPEMFKHVHPGSVGKIRELAPREVSVVEQKVTSSSVTSRR